MKYRRFGLIAFICGMILLSANLAEADAMLNTGDSAPDFTAKTLDGTDFQVSKSIARNPVVLVFIRGFS